MHPAHKAGFVFVVDISCCRKACGPTPLRSAKPAEKAGFVCQLQHGADRNSLTCTLVQSPLT
jgi:hypothetical protein